MQRAEVADDIARAVREVSSAGRESENCGDEGSALVDAEFKRAALSDSEGSVRVDDIFKRAAFSEDSGAESSQSAATMDHRNRGTRTTLPIKDKTNSSSSSCQTREHVRKASKIAGNISKG